MIAVLALTVVVAVAFMAIALNHAAARIGLIEVALNEGLPPGHEILRTAGTAAQHVQIDGLLSTGVHVFLSRSCHACMRLIDELATAPLYLEGDGPAVHLRYIDRPRPIAHSAAQASAVILHTQQGELSTQLGADPLPYTIAVGEHQSQARGVSPTRKDIVRVARDAGYTMHDPMRDPMSEPASRPHGHHA